MILSGNSESFPSGGMGHQVCLMLFGDIGIFSISLLMLHSTQKFLSRNIDIHACQKTLIWGEGGPLKSWGYGVS